MMFFKRKEGQGFTLIELLVAFAIITAISTIVLVSLSATRGKSRDQRRVIDMSQYKAALKFYYNDTGAYPACSDYQDFSCLQNFLKNGYLKDPPQGPGFTSGTAGLSNPASGYHYDNWCNSPGPGSNTQRYRIWSATEYPQQGLTYNWWTDNYVGATNCVDPS